MHILDILLCIITLIIAVALIRKKQLNQILGWMILDIGIILSHMFFDTIRWQVFVLYGFPVAVIIYCLLRQIEWVTLHKIVTRLTIALILILVMVSIAFTIIMPVPELDAPDGPYTVGTTLMNLQDTSRAEIFGPKEGSRELRLQVWYPSDSNENKSETLWLIDGKSTLDALCRAYELPSFALDHFSEVKTNSYKDTSVSITENKYPVIVMSHGWSSSRLLHQNFAETLASHGYIVIGIDHTYIAAMTRLKNGDIADFDHEILPEEDFIDEGKSMIEVFSADIEYVINQLGIINEEHKILKQKMDLETIGLLGHSTGAGADVMYAMEHEVSAIIGFDAWVEPFEITDMPKAPSLFIRSGEWHDGPNNENLKKITDYVYEMKDSRHQDFSLAHLLSPAQKWVGLSGGDTSALQEALIVDFFNQTLKNIPSDGKVYLNQQLRRDEL